MWEVEIWKITVPGQPRPKISFQDPISMEKKLEVVAHSCHPS
jgi:hypothetical protein